MLNYLSQVAALSAGALTVRAQTVNPNDDGMLVWPTLAPRVDVASVELNDVYAIEKRVATDRREWNGKGRHVPVFTPPQRKVSIVPIEGYARINEQEMQKLNELAFAAGGGQMNQSVLVNLIGARLPDRVKAIALANFRRVELDFFESWVKGTITQRNPQNTAQSYAASWAFSASRIQTAGTAWNDGSVNAWDEFMAWLADGIAYIGAIGGAMMRSATLAAIRADAPTNLNGVKYSLVDLQKLVADETGDEFTFFKNDRTVKTFTDGGDTVADAYVFPAHYVAAIPVSGTVGETAFAPVVRADDLEGYDAARSTRGIDLSEIDVRGNRVFYSKENNGKTAEVEVQVNALSIPNEQTLWTINAGV